MAYKPIVNPFTGDLQLVNIPSGSGSGNVTGVPPTTIDAIARWVATDGSAIKDSPGTQVQDGGAVVAVGFITPTDITTAVTVAGGQTWIAPNLTIENSADVVIELGGTILIVS